MLQTFGQLKLPIEELDLSNNLIRRIPEKAFDGLKDSLNELRLANNLLGDNLNPIFSTAELHALKNLRLLDLSGNKIKLIEEGVLKGCMDLKEFFMDRNSLTAVPVNSLNGPSALKHLSLRQNHIGELLFKSEIDYNWTYSFAFASYSLSGLLQRAGSIGDHRSAL